MSAKDEHTLKAFLESEAYDGPPDVDTRGELYRYLAARQFEHPEVQP